MCCGLFAVDQNLILRCAVILTMKTRWFAVMSVTEATTHSVLDSQTFLKVRRSKSRHQLLHYNLNEMLMVIYVWQLMNLAVYIIILL